MILTVIGIGVVAYALGWNHGATRQRVVVVPPQQQGGKK